VAKLIYSNILRCDIAISLIKSENSVVICKCLPARDERFWLGNFAKLTKFAIRELGSITLLTVQTLNSRENFNWVGAKVGHPTLVFLIIINDNFYYNCEKMGIWQLVLKHFLIWVVSGKNRN
jgi:hypothetical protein